VTIRSLPYTYVGPDAPPGLPPPEAILGRAAGENFKVASRLLAGSGRRHLLAFYGYARLVDELGDSYEGDRLAALDWVEADVHRALEGPDPAHPLVAPAAASVLELEVDPQPLFDLIEANRLDQRASEWRTFDDLLSYCRLSANPVGRLVLGAFGRSDAGAVAYSDQVCTGLQLVEHWQDVQEDARAGRIYLPEVDLRRFAVDPTTLSGPGPAPAELRALMVFETARARDWLERGAPLVGLLSGRARFAVAGFVAGGFSALDDISARDFDVLRAPRRVRPLRLAGRTLLTALRRSGGTS
jgi:squalene synthase HpnC